jgi:hypothetical protein
MENASGGRAFNYIVGGGKIALGATLAAFSVYFGKELVKDKKNLKENIISLPGALTGAAGLGALTFIGAGIKDIMDEHRHSKEMKEK